MIMTNLQETTALAAKALFALVFGWSLSAQAAETVLFNESSAWECYQAALHGGDDADVDVCTRAIDHQPLVKKDLAATYSNRGLLQARLGDLKEALKDHDTAVRIEPTMGSLYINRSNTLVRAKRLDDALGDLEQAIAIGDESQAAAYYNRALLFQRLGDRRAARQDAERAAQLSPQTEAYRRYAAELTAAGATDDALGEAAVPPANPQESPR